MTCPLIARAKTDEEVIQTNTPPAAAAKKVKHESFSTSYHAYICGDTCVCFLHNICML